jgi:hypothetical protein
MRYAVQLLITTPGSKGKSVQCFWHGQALLGPSHMKLTSVEQMFRVGRNTGFLNMLEKHHGETLKQIIKLDLFIIDR